MKRRLTECNAQRGINFSCQEGDFTHEFSFVDAILRRRADECSATYTAVFHRVGVYAKREGGGGETI